MTIPDYNKKLDGVIKDMKSGANAEIMVKLGVAALTKIKNRVQTTGVDAKGKKYASYSTKDTLVGCSTFIQKSACAALLGSKPKRKELEWRTVNGHHLAILKGGYKKIRELQGRQTNYVDFTVTGRLWDDINIISKSGNHANGEVIIGARIEEEKKILAGNTKRKGDILDLSVKEQDELKQGYNLGVLQIFKNNGL